MEITRNETSTVGIFEDVIEYAEYADTVPASNYSKMNNNNKFCGGTYREAMKQAVTGNPDLVKSLFEGVNVLVAMIEEEKIGEIRDVAGEYFDVADHLSGEPEVFRRDEFGYQKPVVPIYASFSMNSGISTSTIMNRGCAIVALADELNKTGFIIDLNMVHAVRYNGHMYYTKIKLRNDPIDLDAMAFIVANPLCLRRLWFSILELYAGNSSCADDCYGRPEEYDLSEIFATGLSGFYFTSSNHDIFESRNYSSLDSAKAHILGMVEQFKSSASQIILG